MNYKEYTVKVYKDGTKEWFLNGKLHREDGPAIECADGGRRWYRNGELHREDGPAVEWSDGTKYWYRNGLRHREDGPAIEYYDGTKRWHLEGVEHSKEQFEKKMSPQQSCEGAKNVTSLLVKIDGKKYKLMEV